MGSSPLNPYQSPFPDSFLDDDLRGRDEAIESYIRLVNSLRDRIQVLEGENERLKWQLVGPSVVSVGWPEPIVVMEGADIDE